MSEELRVAQGIPATCWIQSCSDVQVREAKTIVDIAVARLGLPAVDSSLAVAINPYPGQYNVELGSFKDWCEGIRASDAGAIYQLRVIQATIDARIIPTS
jgi:hypothetical protein